MNLLDLLFPKSCFGCGQSATYLCKECVGKVSKSKNICYFCGKAAIDGITHTKCSKPLGLDGLVSVWKYEAVIRKTILKLKYSFIFDVAKELADHISKESKNLFFEEITLVPIPLYCSRKRWRGFNQSEVVGKLIAENLGWGFEPGSIVRNVPTKPQAGLKKKERKKNVRGAFSLNPIYHLQSTNYVLFDDVWTTGATMREACKVLKRGGAKTVWGLTIAS